VVEVLGRNQLQDRVAQILQALVVRRPALRVLVVVRAVGQRLTQQRRLVKANSKRPLEFL
jgi:hypothetical protein